jgi:hypothetical protein
LFQFLENDVMSGLYWESWYNTGEKGTKLLCPDGSRATGPCPVPPADRNIMYENRVLGLARIRMVKAMRSEALQCAVCACERANSK